MSFSFIILKKNLFHFQVGWQYTVLHGTATTHTNNTTWSFNSHSPIRPSPPTQAPSPWSAVARPTIQKPHPHTHPKGQHWAQDNIKKRKEKRQVLCFCSFEGCLSSNVAWRAGEGADTNTCYITFAVIKIILKFHSHHCHIIYLIFALIFFFISTNITNMASEVMFSDTKQTATSYCKSKLDVKPY